MRAPKGRRISDRVKAHAEQLVKSAGSKKAAIEAINDSEERGEPGRQPGSSKYNAVDAQKLFELESLQNEYRKARSRPKRRTLISAIVPEEPELHDMGKSKNAAVTRLANRGSLARHLVKMIRQHRPDLLQFLPKDVDALLRAREGNPESANFASIFQALLFLFGPDLHARALKAEESTSAQE